MKHIITLVALAALACASAAATLTINVSRLNQSVGDRLQYRLPNQGWITLDPAYGQAKVYGVPDNYIVVARVYNIYQQRTLSSVAKATMRQPVGDADRYGNVYFYLYGSG